MAFGAFAPLPLRLGGTAQDGWSVAQHARMAADVAAIYGSKCFAWLTYLKAGSTVTVEAYSGRNGVGVAAAPTPTVNGTGDVTWTWPSTWTDGVATTHTINIRHATGTVHTDGGVVAGMPTLTPAGRTCRVKTWTHAGVAADRRITVRVWSPEKRRREHYGGSDAKRTSKFEGRSPYAWGWYQHVQSGRGSLYTKDRTTLVHYENLAHARAEASVSRCAEKLAANSEPWTSDERLAYWAEVLNVTVRKGDLVEDVRARVAAKRQLGQGPSIANIAAACEALLGAAFVQLWTDYGAALTTPPAPTYWPGVNPGPAAYDLGGGAWFSARMHLIVETTRPPGMTTRDYLDLVNTQLFRLLDDTMRSDATFNWAEDVATGFILDESQLDYVGL